jgi:TonB family protein
MDDATCGFVWKRKKKSRGDFCYLGTMKNKGDILLQKWIDGSITHAEERELERLAADDPFLADALAGLRQMPERDHAARVAELKARLRKQDERKGGGMLFYLPRIAAAAAVVAGLFFGLRYFVWNDVQDANVAMTEQPQTSESVTETPSDTTAEFEPQTSKLQNSKTPNQETPNPQNRQLAPAETIVADEPAPAEAGEMAPMAEIQEEKVTTAPPPPPPPMPKKEADSAEKIERSSAIISKELDDANALQTSPAAPRTITGTITDERAEPLIGATVLVKGTQIGTVTDVDGGFQLEIPENAEQLVISYTGFAMQKIPLGDSDTINLSMNEQGTQLSEVVVSGYEKKSRRETRQPEPRGGFKKLRRYIQRNLEYPEAAAEAKIEGEVKVEFQVQPDGTLTDFEVLESLGYGCDAEAIRLLRAGPKWRLFQAPQNRATYTILFELN